MTESFNYEDIYEILRNEKFSSDLQELLKEDLKKIKEYFEERSKSLEGQDQSTNLFATHNRAKVQLELDNATRVLRDLHEKRERKIINRAIFNSRIDDSIRDTTNMLQLEEELYEQLIFILKRFRKGFLATIDNDGEYPLEILQPLKLRKDVDVKKLMEETDNLIEEENKTDSEDSLQGTESSKEEYTKDETLEPSEETPTYIATTDIPKFFGPDLREHGPFNTNEDVQASEEIINILLNQEKIKIKEPTASKDSQTESNQTDSSESSEESV